MFSGRWWGGGSTKKDNAREAIVSLRAHIETLKKREVALETERDKAEAEARKLVSTNKEKARDALRRKKRRETELEKLWGQMTSLEQQLGAIEGANLNSETMKVMAQGAAAMKSIHKGLDIDKLDATMDEVRDQVALGDEISEAISRPLQETDDVELEDELEELEQEALDQRMISAGPAPASRLPGSQAAAERQADHAEALSDDEDAILEQLRAEMAA